MVVVLKFLFSLASLVSLKIMEKKLLLVAKPFKRRLKFCANWIKLVKF